MIRLDGRKHQIPRCLNSFFGDLEARVDVSAVKGGRCIHRGRARDFKTHVQYYNSHNGTGGTLRVRVQYHGFITYFNLEVRDGAARDVMDYISMYRANGYGNQNGNGGNGN